MSVITKFLVLKLSAEKADPYLGCCCFSPAVRSLSAPLEGFHLSSDPRTIKSQIYLQGSVSFSLEA